MHRPPNLERKHKICVICEGYEDFAYFNRLLELNVWNSAYEFYPINVKSASNISARFQDVFQNDKYELILIFCDTDKSPYREYIQVKQKINGCNGVQREHNKKLNNGLPILHKVPPKRDYGRYFCIMAEKGGTSHGGLTEKLSPFFHAKKQEVNAYGR